MPRPKRGSVFIELECCICGNKHKARREDKKTCSTKCRKALSRAHAAAVGARDLSSSLRSAGRTKCSNCGIRRDGRQQRCPACGSRKLTEGK